MPTLTPAYGRDYKSKKACIEALEEGKDFVYNDVGSPWDGKMCSVRDFPKDTQLQVRYGNLRKVLIYIVK